MPLWLRERALSWAGTGDRISDAELRALGPAIPEVERSLQPIGMRGLLVLLDRLSAWATSFNIPHDPKAMPAAYQPLAELPADLVERAFTSVMASTTDTFRLPLPGRMAGSMAEALDERRTTLLKLRQMQREGRQSRGRKPTRRATAEEFAAFEAAWARVKAENEARAREANVGRPVPPPEPRLVRNPLVDRFVENARARAAAAGPPPPPPEADVMANTVATPSALAKAASVDL